MQNAGDGNSRLTHPVHDHVRTDGVDPVRGRQVIVPMAGFGIQTDRFERLVEEVAVDQQLRVPPGFPGVPEYSNEIVSSPPG